MREIISEPDLQQKARPLFPERNFFPGDVPAASLAIQCPAAAASLAFR